MILKINARRFCLLFLLCNPEKVFYLGASSALNFQVSSLYREEYFKRTSAWIWIRCKARTRASACKDLGSLLLMTAQRTKYKGFSEENSKKHRKKYKRQKAKRYVYIYGNAKALEFLGDKNKKYIKW
jgi:hypothetical protein